MHPRPSSRLPHLHVLLCLLLISLLLSLGFVPAFASASKLRILLPDESEQRYQPLMARTSTDRMVSELLYQPLLRQREDGAIDYVLLESAEFSSDRRRLSLRLKPDLFWSDGQPLTSQDIAFTYLSLLKEGLDHPFSQHIRQVRGSTAEALPDDALHLEGLRCVDDQTIELHLQEASPELWPQLGQLPIIPLHDWWQTPPRAWADRDVYQQLPVGSGPYILKRLRRSQGMRLERLVQPSLSTPYISVMDLRFVRTEELPALLLAGKGQLADVSQVSPSERDALKEKGFKLQSVADREIYCLYAGKQVSKGSFLNDATVREALSLAIPSKAIGELIYPMGMSGPQILASSYLPFSDAAFSQGYPEDHEKAQSLLKEAGYQVSAPLPDEGKPSEDDDEAQALPDLRLAYEEKKPEAKWMAQLLGQSFERLGLSMELLPVSPARLRDPSMDVADFILRLESVGGLADGVFCRPIAGAMRVFASRDLSDFTPSAQAAFGGAEHWLD